MVDAPVDLDTWEGRDRRITCALGAQGQTRQHKNPRKYGVERNEEAGERGRKWG